MKLKEELARVREERSSAQHERTPPSEDEPGANAESRRLRAPFIDSLDVPEASEKEIIGQSAPLRIVLQRVEIVAPTNATVLIQGETGTGKELIARAIHRLSQRAGQPLAKINCAAIPSGLLESELFGHEKGAFTGAHVRKPGRVELAHHGTLFLDEVGDIPLEIQPKLLRMIQEKEFERLGSTHTQKANVRVVAATSRDLPEMVAHRQFRSDLYYRLNVFPIRVPALRERIEDIPLLVQHFVARHARAMNKQIDSVARDIMDVLVAHPWPGNVRELENFIERSVIMSSGRTLTPPLAELDELGQFRASPVTGPGLLPSTTLENCEREHILRALGQTGWVVGGPNGAAVLLGLKRTTLISKMQKLGITRRVHTPPPIEQPFAS